MEFRLCLLGAYGQTAAVKRQFEPLKGNLIPSVFISDIKETQLSEPAGFVFVVSSHKFHQK